MSTADTADARSTEDHRSVSMAVDANDARSAGEHRSVSMTVDATHVRIASICAHGGER